MLPAVSAQDCLVADLGVDPGDHGWLSYDATDFLVHRRPLDASCALVLWQIGVIGEIGAVSQPDYRHLDLVAERLAAVFGAHHEAVVYEASPYPLVQPIIERVRLGDLPSAPVTPLATLYVPPSAPPSLDETVAERLGLTPIVVNELREVHLGDWEGQLNARVQRDDDLSRRVFLSERWDVIPNAEPMEDFSDRIRRGIDLIVDLVGPDEVAIAVVHGGVIAEACRQVTGSHAFAFLYAENCSITRIVRMRRGRWTLLGFNDTAHLRDGVASPR
jgi:hypothetical protein